jgi:hypothetical protein
MIPGRRWGQAGKTGTRLVELWAGRASEGTGVGTKATVDPAAPDGLVNIFGQARPFAGGGAAPVVTRTAAGRSHAAEERLAAHPSPPARVERDELEREARVRKFRPRL